jgi:prephenate dehydrogenase
MVGLDDRPLELARLTTVLGEAGINIRDIEVLKIRDGGEAIRVGVASDTDLEAARAALSAAGYRWR